MAYQDEVLSTLQSIDAVLKAILDTLRGGATTVPDTRRRAPAQAAGTTAPGRVATASELDSKYGDPVVKFMPRGWKGRSYKNSPMSKCPAELLDALAETFDYFAEQAEKKGEVTPKGKPLADYKRLDAARARGWAKRIRAGTLVPPPRAAGEDGEWATSSEFD